LAEISAAIASAAQTSAAFACDGVASPLATTPEMAAAAAPIKPRREGVII